VIVHFVDTGRIVDHHCLNFLLIIAQELEKYEKLKSLFTYMG
jgi:hypothetical protein